MVGSSLFRVRLRQAVFSGILLCGLACAPTPAPAQPIPDEPSCRDCRIRSDVVVRFGGDLDDGLISAPWAKVYSLRDGWFAASDVEHRGLLKLYGPDGSYVRTVGRVGQGPGEYQGLHDIFRTEDGYLIYDITLGRLSWVDTEFEFQRSTPLGFTALRLALLSDGERLLVNALAGDGLAEGHSLSIVPIGEAPSASFGVLGVPWTSVATRCSTIASSHTRCLGRSGRRK